MDGTIVRRLDHDFDKGINRIMNKLGSMKRNPTSLVAEKEISDIC